MNRIISEEELKLLKEAMGGFDDDDIDFSDFGLDDIDSMGANDSSILNTGGSSGFSGGSNKKGYRDPYFQSKNTKNRAIDLLKSSNASSYILRLYFRNPLKLYAS